MPTVHFTANLARHVPSPTIQVECAPEGATVGESLAAVFERHPRLRGYIVDEQGAVRKHMNVFVDGVQIRDRAGLSDPVTPHSEIYVIQALSGG